MSTLEQFFYMGGYAFYVWTSYALTLAVLMVQLVLPWLWERRLHQNLTRKFQLERKS